MILVFLPLFLARAHADVLGVANITVFPTKSDGEAWDSLGGAPDLEICSIVEANRTCDKTYAGKVQDSFRGSFNVVVPKGAFTIWVYDADVSSDDTIGAAACQHAKGRVTCSASGRVQRAVVNLVTAAE